MKLQPQKSWPELRPNTIFPLLRCHLHRIDRCHPFRDCDDGAGKWQARFVREAVDTEREAKREAFQNGQGEEIVFHGGHLESLLWQLQVLEAAR